MHFIWFAVERKIFPNNSMMCQTAYDDGNFDADARDSPTECANCIFIRISPKYIIFKNVYIIAIFLSFRCSSEIYCNWGVWGAAQRYRCRLASATGTPWKQTEFLNKSIHTKTMLMSMEEAQTGWRLISSI